MRLGTVDIEAAREAGGGGLAAGVAIAVKEHRPDVTVMGVHADAICGVLAASGYEIVPQLPSRSVVSSA